MKEASFDFLDESEGSALSVEEKLNLAIQLRSEERLSESNQLLVELARQNADNAYIQYQCAWSFDRLGEESKAVPYYKAAIQGGLEKEDLENAYLGLGSTYRALGEYEKSKTVFEKAILQFPDHQGLKVFYAMTLYNLRKHEKAMSLLLNSVVAATSDQTILNYKKAIEFYADKLDKTWED